MERYSRCDSRASNGSPHHLFSSFALHVRGPSPSSGVQRDEHSQQHRSRTRRWRREQRWRRWRRWATRGQHRLRWREHRRWCVSVRARVVLRSLQQHVQARLHRQLAMQSRSHLRRRQSRLQGQVHRRIVRAGVSCSSGHREPDVQRHRAGRSCDQRRLQNRWRCAHAEGRHDRRRRLRAHGRRCVSDRLHHQHRPRPDLHLR